MNASAFMGFLGIGLTILLVVELVRLQLERRAYRRELSAMKRMIGEYR